MLYISEQILTTISSQNKENRGKKTDTSVSEALLLNKEIIFTLTNFFKGTLKQTSIWVCK